jgi:hypothetical protein
MNKGSTTGGKITERQITTTTGNGLEMGRKFAAEEDAKEREICRLRTALAKYAKRDNWSDAGQVYADVFLPTDNGWEIAEAALAGEEIEEKAGAACTAFEM